MYVIHEGEYFLLMEVAAGLTLDNTVTLTTFRQLALSLDDQEPADETTNPWDIEQGESASIDEGS